MLLSLALRFVLNDIILRLCFTKECCCFFTSIVIMVCQYFCGDNIDPAFIQVPQPCRPSSSVVVPSRDLILPVLLLFSSRFSFPEQRLNGEATTRTIRPASCVIESPSPLPFSPLLGFHFLPSPPPALWQSLLLSVTDPPWKK